MLRVVVELAPQIAYERSHKVCLSGVFLPPYTLKELVICQHPSRVGGKLGKQLVLGGGK
jgi:hypothetical protein